MNPQTNPGPLWPETVDPLRGGLKGRLAEDFCVLQSTVDALARFLDQQAPEPVRSTGMDTLREMSHRILRLERLADNTADLALGAQLRGLRELLPLELTEHLQTLCACAGEELAACGHPVRILLRRETQEALWLEGDDSLINNLLANLLSNSVRAGARQVELTCTADRRLLYRDDGAGADPAVMALLTEGTVSRDLLASGGTGILLVREYAAALGWSLRPGQGSEGFAVEFVLPRYRPEPSRLDLADDAKQREQAAALCRSRLRREFASVLPLE